VGENGLEPLTKRDCATSSSTTELTPPNDNHKQFQSSGGVKHLLIAYGYLLSVIAASSSGICCYWYLLLPHGSLVGEPVSLDYKGMYFISIYQIYFKIFYISRNQQYQ